MAGIVAQPPPTTTPVTPHSDPTQNRLTATQLNSFSVDAVVDRIATQLRLGFRSDPRELFALYIALSRGIDDAIVSSDVPSSAQKLPALLKQVCHRQNEPRLQAAVMVLMFSVKNACWKGWFLIRDAEEILILANEIGRSFCSSADVNIEPSSVHLVITNVLLRFFPRMKMGNVLASLKVKPGYGTFPVDFHTLKDTEKNTHLLVVQSDSILTSSCLISPPKVNFLINGKGVKGRFNLSLDTEPQVPTIVNTMLTHGTNLLQVIGEFSGNYIIAICFMTLNTSSEAPALQDYVHPVASADSEILEGTSRVSLKCPISSTRIKTPVKGQLCKHYQCFDFENYIEINSRRPSWRCPQCNQSVCYTDLRIDRHMVKILKEVAENILYVDFSADGSWKPLVEMNDQTDTYHDRTVGSEQCISARSLNNIVDITMEKSEENDAMDICDTEDRKPFKDVLPVPLEISKTSELHSYSFTGHPLVSEISNTSEASQNLISQAQDDLWSEFFTASPSTFSRSASLDVSGLPATNPTMTPVDVYGASQATFSIPQTQSSAPGDQQLQYPQVGNSLITTEFGRSVPTYVHRNPIAVQAVDAPSQAIAPHNLPISNSNSSMSSGFPVGGATASSEVERQQLFSRSHLNSSSTPGISSSSMLCHSNVQNWDHLDRSHVRSPPHQNWNHHDRHHIRSSPLQVPGLPVTSDVTCSGIPSENHRQPPIVLPSTYIPPVRAHQGGTQLAATREVAAANSHTRPMGLVHRSTPVTRLPPVVPIQLQPPKTGSSFPMSTDRSTIRDHQGTTELPSEQNWRPTGRMRGSLSGRTYSEAIARLIIQPTQSGQAPRPTSLDAHNHNTDSH